MKYIRYGITLIITLIISLIVGISIGNFYNFSANAGSGSDVVGRGSIDITTMKIIEYQSGYAPLGTLRQNAISAGYNPTNVLEKYVNQSEYQAYMDSLRPAPKPVTATYQQAIDDLNLIINTTNPTNAQVVWAIKRMAEIEKKELQYHRLETELN